MRWNQARIQMGRPQCVGPFFLNLWIVEGNQFKYLYIKSATDGFSQGEDLGVWGVPPSKAGLMLNPPPPPSRPPTDLEAPPEESGCIPYSLERR